MKLKKSLLVLALVTLNAYGVIPGFNFFTPYDVLITPPEKPDVCWQFSLGYEGAVQSRSYQADEDENGNSQCFRKRADILQLWQDEQDLLAALKGDDFTTELGMLSQQFNLADDDGTFGLFVPCADFSAHNIMLSALSYISDSFAVSVHLPIISMKLKDVSWNKSARNTNETFDGQIIDDFVAEIERIGSISLYDWNRTGVGDLACLLSWARYFPQAGRLLHNVHLGVRTGMTFPTGKNADPDILFGVPFGYNAGIGIVLGGNLELWLADYYRLGIDIDLLQLFGKTAEYRIKTDIAQTDLVFLNKVLAYNEPGFIQHYTLYCAAYNFCRGLGARCAYQYTKQQDDKLFLRSNHFDCIVANSAESLQEWTTHSFIFNVNYDFYHGENNSAYKPHISLFYKHGFNGSRATLLDTVGAVLSIDF